MSRFKKSRHLLFYCGLRFLEVIANLIPRRLALGAFGALGSLVGRLDKTSVRRSLSHLDLALGPSLSADERRRIVREMFRQAGRSAADLLRMPHQDSKARLDLVTYEGLEHLDRARRGGKRGVVVLTAHLSNWEMLGATLADLGYPVLVQAREVFDDRTDRLIRRWRDGWGATTVRRSEGLFPVVRELRRGGMVGSLVDQDIGGPSVYVPFFGLPARTTIAPFQLARRTGSALVPMFIARTPDDRYVAWALPEIEQDDSVPAGPDLVRQVGEWHEGLEEALRKYPEQWVWFHKRWKSRPPEGEVDLQSISRKVAYVQSNQEPSSGSAIAR